MANYTETEKEQSFRGNDYTGIKEDKPFGGSVHGSCGVILTNKLVKTAKNCPKKNFTPLSAIPLNALK